MEYAEREMSAGTIGETQSSMPHLRIVLAIPIIFYLLLGFTAGYRAFFQIESVTIHPRESALHPLSVIDASVVTYGRTFVDVKIELAQDGHTKLLATSRIPTNEFAFWDPRRKRASITTKLTREQLEGFEEGPALLRIAATGRPQLTRVPPPKVDEFPVEIQSAK